uniref:Globin family profile domain-containing protein n=1 Tax=Plectus sambesii TaxID=2011161 RepID=A0A914VJJ8_9BILA
MSCGCLRTRTSSTGDLPRPAAAQADTNGAVKPDDPRIPLNTRQKFTLVKNWKGISRQATETGANMFVKMLSENPDLYDMFAFRGLKSKDQSKQLENELLQLHAEAVMNKMEEPFLYAVKLTLDERYTDNMDAVYRIVIKLILETMEQACRKAANEKKS